jgi:hypothetical protein
MGWSLSWIAVRGKPVEQVWQELELRPCGRSAETPNVPFCSAVLSGGWVLVCAHKDDRFAKEALLRRVSLGSDVVGCYVEEHVNFSQSARWNDGVKRWSVTHSGEHAEDHLDAHGDLPAEFPALAAEARAALEREPEADWFSEPPVDLAKRLTGFRHDDDYELRFDELEPTARFARTMSRHRGKMLVLKVVGFVAAVFAVAATIGLLRRWLRGG